jgi:phosphoglycerate kinase
MLRNIKEIPVEDLEGQSVLLRLDLNAPLNKEQEIVDDFRIRKAMPIINYLSKAGARIRIISHIGAGKEDTLEPVSHYITHKFNQLLTFVTDIFHPQTTLLLNMQKHGEVVLFENIRRYQGEEKNDMDFAKRLSALGDIYINDAFAVSHRKHASIVGVPLYIPGYAGLQFMEEIEHLHMAFSASHPFVFILGGAKFDTKLLLLKKFLDIADIAYAGGAIANELFEESGLVVGRSLTTLNPDLQQQEILRHKNLRLPSDVVVSGHATQNTVKQSRVKASRDVQKTETIADIGPKSLLHIEKLISDAKFVLWNGPFGNYEQGFTQGTEKIADMISKCGAMSIIGGGDTLAAIHKLHLEDKFTFVSTGGGAMLDFLVHETLAGIKSLSNTTPWRKGYTMT